LNLFYQNCVNKDQLLTFRLAALQQRFPIPQAFALAGVGEGMEINFVNFGK